MPRTALYFILGLLLTTAGAVCYSIFSVSNIDLHELESASKNDYDEAIASNTYIRLGEHYRIYSHLIYAQDTTLDDPTAIDAIWYPVVSDQHTLAEPIKALRKEYGEYARVPQRAVPMVEQFAVLVRTSQFDTRIELPRGVDWADHIQGELYRYSTLSEAERSIIKRAYPKVDLNRVIVLQHERVPSGIIIAIGLLLMGVPLLILPLIGVVLARVTKQG